MQDQIARPLYLPPYTHSTENWMILKKVPFKKGNCEAPKASLAHCWACFKGYLYPLKKGNCLSYKMKTDGHCCKMPGRTKERSDGGNEQLVAFFLRQLKDLGPAEV